MTQEQIKAAFARWLEQLQNGTDTPPAADLRLAENAGELADYLWTLGGIAP